ncbi:MAG TPA: TlpA disulfide reductase family protein [Pyrinomonadaceae bacterium]|nr:TlpA disulfide reductase family protein [Pyrinomonadaceae bacterium]
MLKKRPLFFVIMALVVALAGVGLSAPGVAAPQTPLQFRLRTTDGGEISSQMLRGDVVVLAFGASWLPLSRDQVRGVQELADEFGERQVRVYWVSTDSDKPGSKNFASDEQLRAFARRNGLKVAVLRDPDGALFKRMGVAGNQLPAVVILNQGGEVNAPTIGGFDPGRKLVDTLSPRLNTLLGR